MTPSLAAPGSADDLAAAKARHPAGRLLTSHNGPLLGFSGAVALLTGPWRVNDPTGFAATMTAAPTVCGHPVTELSVTAGDELLTALSGIAPRRKLRPVVGLGGRRRPPGGRGAGRGPRRAGGPSGVRARPSRRASRSGPRADARARPLVGRGAPGRRFGRRRPRGPRHVGLSLPAPLLPASHGLRPLPPRRPPGPPHLPGTRGRLGLLSAARRRAAPRPPRLTRRRVP